MKINNNQHITKDGVVKSNREKKLRTTNDFFDSYQLRNAPIIERETYGSVTLPAEHEIRVVPKPLRLIGTFNSLFKFGDHIGVINPRTQEVVKQAKKVGDKVILSTMGGPNLTVSLDDDLFYEEWFMDNGSILFYGPNKELYKIMTEGDYIKIF